jgi:hypothetical protein
MNFETFLDKMTAFVNAISTDQFFGFIIIGLFLVAAVIFYQEQKKEKLDWTDLITKPGSNIISLTKVLQLVGGMVATWIMVKLTMQGKIGWEMFSIYLAYVASVDGFSKYISAKYGVNAPSTSTEETPSKLDLEKELTDVSEGNSKQ